jgi:Fe-S cluster biosynthesis and repair protein YggX
MGVVSCTRCGQAKEQLPEPPTGGTLGERILQEICADCWAEWRETGPRLINHYGLNLGHPEHRAELRRVMKEFLGLESAPRT